jgi:diguanylate cyclase (GGDEF)-like protein
MVAQLEPAGSVLVTFQLNLAELHLAWALELYRVSQPEEAEKHSAVALSHALLARQLAPTDNTYWRDVAAVYVGCARADGDDPAGAAEQIRGHAEPLMTGQYLDWWRFSVPFLAVALSRSGRRDEALTLVEQVLAELPADIEWYNVAALTHTQAILLSANDEPELRATLRYGDCLAAALWRQRLQTLHAVRTMRSLQQLRVEHELVARSADTDALTGVANRRAYDRELVRRADAAAGAGHTAVLVIDLDKFKPLNDRQGHAAGDRALQAIATALAAEIRTGDLLARIGGDEFCVLLDAVDDQSATQVADRMVHCVRALELTVTASIGVAVGPADALSDTLARADHAMYAAKAAGGDRAECAAGAVAGDRAVLETAP